MHNKNMNQRAPVWARKIGSFAVLMFAGALAQSPCFASDESSTVPDSAQAAGAVQQEPEVRDDVESEEVTGSLIHHRKHHYTQGGVSTTTTDDAKAQGFTDMSGMTGLKAPVAR